MHILLTNDDGPPNQNTSPYINTFIQTLTSPPFSHTVSVVLPTTQRSWIGKAHLLPPTLFPGGEKTKGRNEDVTDVVQPLYYEPSSGELFESLVLLRESKRINKETKRLSDSPTFPEYYVLVPGTPATCVQLGLFHHDLLFPTESENTSNYSALSSPIDLVLSGPNYGRNTTAAFALSSGTIGGAMEGAVCGVRAIALSFAFFTRQETEAMIADASFLGAKISQQLVNQWDSEGDNKADLYSINIPLDDEISKKPVHWTWMLDNKWSTGSLYKNVDTPDAIATPKTGPGDASGQVTRTNSSDDLKARSGKATTDGVPHSTGRPNDGSVQAPTFRWSPEFRDVWRTVEMSAPGNDGQIIRQKLTSVTPLKANFMPLYGKTERFSGEMKL